MNFFRMELVTFAQPSWSFVANIQVMNNAMEQL